MKLKNVKNTIILGDDTGIKFLINVNTKGSIQLVNDKFRVDEKFSITMENYTNCSLEVVIHPRKERILLKQDQMTTYEQDDFDENHNFWIEFIPITVGSWVQATSFELNKSCRNANVTPIYFTK
jgi:hypothetical protein